jgi:hypothetical protein
MQLTKNNTIKNATDAVFIRRVSIIGSALMNLTKTISKSDKYVTMESVAEIYHRSDLFLSQAIPSIDSMVTDLPIPDDTTPLMNFINTFSQRWNSKRRLIRGYIRDFLTQPQKEALVNYRIVLKLDELLFGSRHRHTSLAKLLKPRGKSLPITRFMLQDLDAGRMTMLAEAIAAKYEKLFDDVDRSLVDWHVLTKTNKAVAFITHLFPTTWVSFSTSLGRKGVKSLWIGMCEVDYFSGYGVIENRDIPVDAQIITPYIGMVYAMCQAENTELLLSGECFYGANWNFEAASVMYSILSSVAQTVNSQKKSTSNLTYLMYDGIKPVSARVEGGRELGKSSLLEVLYKDFMSRADKIIFNSNGTNFTDFIRNTCPVTPNIANFYRFGEAPKSVIPRLPYTPDSVHMVCITVALCEFEEPSRDSVDYYVQQIVESGVYFHYYCDEASSIIDQFRKRLKPEFRKYFITHPIQKDPSRLIEEISQYHVGFNPSDHLAFAKAISMVNCRFYRDAMATFLQSTFGTSFLVYAAAGLPFILPRGCTFATEFLAPLSIPLSFSEFAAISKILRTPEFAKTLKDAPNHSGKYFCDQHIHSLISFLWNDNLNSSATSV